MVTFFDRSPSIQRREISQPSGVPDVTTMLQWAGRAEKHDQSTAVTQQVTVTLDKVPVTPPTSHRVVWQAEMCKRMSHVRGYVPLHITKWPEYLRTASEQPEKSEKYP